MSHVSPPVYLHESTAGYRIIHLRWCRLTRDRSTWHGPMPYERAKERAGAGVQLCGKCSPDIVAEAVPLPGD